MCGLVGAIAQRNVAPILVEGLKRLEYRGYDSAGVAVMNDQAVIERTRTAGKVMELDKRLADAPLPGVLGVAHTRWATHGEPVEKNAHPHVSGSRVALVHNGIIENHESLRTKLTGLGYTFSSDTDTEVIAHLVDHNLGQGQDLLAAVQNTITELEGAYGIAVITPSEPHRLVAARSGSPLVVGLGIGEHFVASDVAALLPVTKDFIFLEEGDVVDLTIDSLQIYDHAGAKVERETKISELSADSVERGEYRHYMLKEIYEQPKVLAAALEDRVGSGKLLEAAFGRQAADIFDQVKAVHIIACGTSYHSGSVARYWIESLAKVPCNVEIASEYRYRDPVIHDGTLFVTLSQSGETADTLAALRMAKESGYLSTLAICNVPESSLVRESDLVMMTRAGPEIGVASTKAFTTQLVVLLLLAGCLAKRKGLTEDQEAGLVQQMQQIPAKVTEALALAADIEKLAEEFTERHHALFLGRGAHYPVAMEGALKLKEISYIHAEAYAAGELKHGPLALVDADMPVVAVAPNDELLEKLKSNLQEVRARGGQLFVFADPGAEMSAGDGVSVLHIPEAADFIAPVIYTIPLQLLSYYVAVLKGTDVDQPRNLAKSVTVE